MAWSCAGGGLGGALEGLLLPADCRAAGCRHRAPGGAGTRGEARGGGRRAHKPHYSRARGSRAAGPIRRRAPPPPPARARGCLVTASARGSAEGAGMARSGRALGRALAGGLGCGAPPPPPPPPRTAAVRYAGRRRSDRGGGRQGPAVPGLCRRAAAGRAQPPRLPTL